MRVLWLLILVPLVAWSEPPSDAAIRRLLEVTEVRKGIDLLVGDLDANMQTAMRTALEGRQLTPPQQEAMDRMRGRMVELFRKQLSWERLETMSVSLYRDSFTSDEVNGLIAFYESPLGRTVAEKMPVVMRQSMAYTQQMLMEIQPELRTIQADLVRELQRLESATLPPVPGSTPAPTP
jgi:uncharacterized protein